MQDSIGKIKQKSWECDSSDREVPAQQVRGHVSKTQYYQKKKNVGGLLNIMNS
jgi:hypothetical protein